MKIKAFTGIGTRPRQEDAYAIVEIPSSSKPSTQPIGSSTRAPEEASDPFITNLSSVLVDENPDINTPEIKPQNTTPSNNANDTARTLIVVADGMGGHECGDVASKLVVKELATYWKGNPRQNDSETKIKQAVVLAGIAYERKAQGREMGSTMVMATIEGDHGYIAHCGDSRIYVWHKDKHQFFHTNDHIRFSEFGYELVANAFFTGNCYKIIPEIRYLEFHPGDRLMLCTDGVFKYVPMEDLRRIFTGDSDLTDAAQTLEDYCKAMSRDNYTAVLVEF